jgi:iron complex transport system substrate-binding protein
MVLPEMRIVSLVPSATEIVCALGLADALVGVSGDCTFPPEVQGKTILTDGIVAAESPSGRIDRRIRGELHAGKSVYHFDGALLRSLSPDLILTQELCPVCAPSYTMVTRTAKTLEGETRIVSLDPRGFLDVLDTILLIGDVTGRRDRAEALVSTLRSRIESVSRRVRGARPRAACLEWLDPVYVAGHWVPEMVAIAGGCDVLGKPREASFAVEWEDVLAAQPDVLLLMPCGFDIGRTRREITLLSGRAGWETLPAMRWGRVYLADATSYFSRPGPRIVDSLEILAATLHPETFSYDFPPGAVERL